MSNELEADVPTTLAKVTVCGGRNGKNRTIFSSCFTLSNGKWAQLPKTYSLNTKRIYAASVKLNNQWWVTGGGVGGEYKATDSTELRNSSGQWNYHTKLPKPLFGHCMVNIDKDTVFLTGGETHQLTKLKSTYQYNEKLGWKNLRDMPTPRLFHSCALLEDKNTIIVAGGFNKTGMLQSSDLYSIKDNTWSAGPELASGPQNGAVMLTLGGTTYQFGGHPPATRILRLDKDNEGKLKWSDAGRLTSSKWFFPAVPIQLSPETC